MIFNTFPIVLVNTPPPPVTVVVADPHRGIINIPTGSASVHVRVVVVVVVVLLLRAR